MEFQTEEEFLAKYRAIYRQRAARRRADRLRLRVAEQAHRVVTEVGDQRLSAKQAVRSAIGGVVQAAAGVTRYRDIPDEAVDDLLPLVARVAELILEERRRRCGG